MSFENSDFHRNVAAEACLGVCEGCPEIVPQVAELQAEVDLNTQRLEAALSDTLGDIITAAYVDLNKKDDDPEGQDVPALPPEVLERKVVNYRRAVADEDQQFEGYVSDQITSLRDFRGNCDGPLRGQITLGARVVQVTVCNRPGAPSGPSLEPVWVQRD